AVLSDTESDEKNARRMLSSLGIEQYFDAVVTSRDIGYAKPAREAYQAAADALGVAPDRCGFVGHDADELAGAKEVGLCAIAYNSHPGAPADVHIDHFSKLKHCVSLARQAPAIGEDRTTEPLFSYEGATVCQQDFIEALKKVGLQKGDVCFVHSSLFSFGRPAMTRELLMDLLIDAFGQVVGPEGTIAMPTFTFGFCKGQVFDVTKSKSTCGALTERFRSRPGVVRSKHPIFSVAVSGRYQKELSQVGMDAFG
ncbi:unnamed protein product, partial [marine sediment metagenome]